MDSLFGLLVLRRNYYAPRPKGSGRAPLDQSLGVVEGCMPWLARLMCRAGAREPFADAGQSLLAYCGLKIQARRIQRVVQRLGPEFARWNQSQAAPTTLPQGTFFYVEADATGIPVRPEVVAGRQGKGLDAEPGG